ncbi:MAG: lysylphosphatidylglycerol synthase transmembrane domain-containing protein [Methylococcales bacterium]|nr:lysylphosphatidylglycerol synthase transmembrane domain-containing protein [Methylococcales bacterium]
MLNKAIFIRILQITIALGLITLIFSQIDKHAIVDLLSHANLSYLLLAFLLLILQITVAAYRWLIIIRLAGFSPPVLDCIRSFGMSSFVNAMVPGGITGDITRIWVTARSGIPSNIATYTVLSDRMLTLVGLGLLITALFLSSGVPMNTVNMFALGISVILIIAFCGLILIVHGITHFKINIPFLLLPITSLSRVMSTLLQYPYQLIALIGIIMAGHMMLILSMAILAYGLQVSLPLQAILIGLPSILLFSAVPITPGGWGLREGVMVLVLKQFHIQTEAALSISILFGLGSTLANLPVALWWFIHKTWSPPNTYLNNGKIS